MIASNAWFGSGLETLHQNRRYVVGCPVVVLQPLLNIILAIITKPEISTKSLITVYISKGLVRYALPKICMILNSTLRCTS